MMNFFSKTRIKRIFLYGFLLTAVLLFFSPLVINRLINTDFVKQRVAGYLHQKTGIFVQPSQFSISILPDAHLTIADFNFDLNTSMQFSIQQLAFDVNFAHLIERRLYIDNIRVNRPSIRLKSPRMTIPGKRSGGGTIQDISIAELDQFKTRIFNYLPQHQSSLHVAISNFSSPYFSSMDAALFLSRETRDIVLNARINHVELDRQSFESTGLNAHVSFGKIKTDALDITLKISANHSVEGRYTFDSPSVVDQKDAILFAAPVLESRFSLSANRQQITVPPFTLSHPKGTIGIEFINNRDAKQSELHFTGSDIDIKEARERTISFVIKNNVVSILFDILRDGMADSVTVSFKNRMFTDLFDVNQMEVSGHVQNGRIKIPQTDLFVSGIQGSASLKKGELGVTADRGTIEGSTIQRGVLRVDLVNFKDYPFKGEFDLDVDLSRIPATLISLLPDTALTRELALVHNVAGRADVRLDLSMTTGSDLPDVKVKTGDFKVTGQYGRIPGDLKIERCRFGYESDQVTLEAVSGSALNSNLTGLSAIIDFKDNPLIDIKKCAGKLDLARMIPWVLSYEKPRAIFAPVNSGGGLFSFSDLSLSGPVIEPEKWRFHINGRAENIFASTKKDQPQIETLSARVDVSDRSLELADLSLILNEIPEAASRFETGTIKALKTFDMPIRIVQSNISMNPSNTRIHGNLFFPEGPNLVADLSGPSVQALSVNQLQLKETGITDVRITPLVKDKEKRFRFDGKLKSSTIDKLFIPESPLLKKIQDYTQKQPILIISDPENNLNVHTRHLNLNALFSQSAPPDINTFFLPDHTIHLNTDKISIKKMGLTDVAARISIEKDHTYIRLNSAMLCDIRTSGYINIKDNIIVADIPFDITDHPNIQDLFTCLMEKEDFMDGTYSLTGHLRTNQDKKDGLRQLQGNLNFQAENGRIYKLTLLSRILSVLNVSSIFKGKIPNVLQKGFSYKTIDIEADIKESRLYLETAVIDGTDMTMIFKGWVDPLNDQLELTCLVAPFKTVDLIVKNIPIINTIFGGRLVSVPVKASGTLSDPTVIPLHPSAVGEGLLDAMSNILKTPVRLWDKMTNE
ncbi:MAG: AsmA-like C-terminal region-containing protein [Desulfobacterales bacterium]|nr:AsmA-like C-terminal region-containing protein [Desulfobacterales bacterium]